MNSYLVKLISIVVICLGLFTQVFAEDAPVEKKEVVKYLSLTPSFVANFGASDGKKLKFVKADISVRASSSEAITEVMDNDALVRHQIVMLLSRQTDKKMSSSAGQEEIRLKALKLVQDALQEETGSPQIEDLLFTSFIVQR